ncbi:isochorismatase family protein [Streptomyces sp. NBC_01618]|nr:isochorismatase family protein [Streptomyces sp. NBC_01618]
MTVPCLPGVGPRSAAGASGHDAGAAGAGIVGDAPLVLCGVATECCVLGTAFAAADAGRRVTVVADACAGASMALHEQALVLLEQLAPLVSVVTADRLP